jgi:exodeoxyribonuclease VII large subunit
MWRLDAERVKFRPTDGMEILVRGAMTVYKDRGQLQLQVLEMRSASTKGDLALRFEQLKTKLAAEGLFSYKRKRPLPTHPRRIGVVTSLAGAALRDIIRVASERNDGVAILVANARVQGDSAAPEIASAIKRLAATDCDVLIVGRGGGSIEDLWAFNEEIVVRAVAASPIPVVSAVGHETDFTLCDLVADARAATPSQAAEIVVPDAGAIGEYLDDADARMASALERLVPDMRQRVDDLLERAVGAVKASTTQRHELLAVNSAHLDALSPLATLARGYAVARANGRALRSVDQAPPGSDVEIVLRDGALDAKVTGARKKEDPR